MGAIAAPACRSARAASRTRAASSGRYLGRRCARARGQAQPLHALQCFRAQARGWPRACPTLQHRIHINSYKWSSHVLSQVCFNLVHRRHAWAVVARACTVRRATATARGRSSRDRATQHATMSKDRGSAAAAAMSTTACVAGTATALSLGCAAAAAAAAVAPAAATVAAAAAQTALPIRR